MSVFGSSSIHSFTLLCAPKGWMCGLHPWAPLPACFQWESLAGDLRFAFPCKPLLNAQLPLGAMFIEQSPGFGDSSLVASSLVASRWNVEMVPCSDQHKVNHILCFSFSKPFANSPVTKITSITQLERVISLRILNAASSQMIGEGCESFLDQELRQV